MAVDFQRRRGEGAAFEFEPIQQWRAHEYVAEQIRRHIALRLIRPGEALQPTVAVAPNGTVGVAFYDRRLPCPSSTSSEAAGSGIAFDPGTSLAFASNGDGTLTVVREDGPDSFRVLENAVTQRSARTMALDVKTHRVFLAAAEFGPAPPPTAEQPRPRPPMPAPPRARPRALCARRRGASPARRAAPSCWPRPDR